MQNVKLIDLDLKKFAHNLFPSLPYTTTRVLSLVVPVWGKTLFLVSPAESPQFASWIIKLTITIILKNTNMQRRPITFAQ